MQHAKVKKVLAGLNGLYAVKSHLQLVRVSVTSYRTTGKPLPGHRQTTTIPQPNHYHATAKPLPYHSQTIAIPRPNHRHTTAISLPTTAIPLSYYNYTTAVPLLYHSCTTALPQQREQATEDERDCCPLYMQDSQACTVLCHAI